MMIYYKCNYTIAYVNYYHYICTAMPHDWRGAADSGRGAPFFVRPRRAERSGVAQRQ